MLIPMTTPLALIFLVMLVLWLATFLRSAVGFGDALLAMPLIALLVGMQVATPLNRRMAPPSPRR